MRSKLFAIATMALVATLGMVLCAPLAGCSGCSADRGSSVIRKIGDGGSSENGSAKAPAKQEDDKASTDTSGTQDAIDNAAETQQSDGNGSSATQQLSPSKTSSNKANEPKSNDSQPAHSKKKWVPEQGHWETDYSQVWVPNVVYTRHERWMCSVCHATFNSAAEMDNHVISTYGDAQHPNGASAINDSYTTSEDQGHYEQQATGQHWVVDTPGHWE